MKYIERREIKELVKWADHPEQVPNLVLGPIPDWPHWDAALLREDGVTMDGIGKEDYVFYNPWSGLYGGRVHESWVEREYIPATDKDAIREQIAKLQALLEEN